MIPRLICFLFGHEESLTARWSEPRNGKHVVTSRGHLEWFCLRCGKPL